MKLIDKILEQSQEFETEVINVPEWEVDLYINPISLLEYRKITKAQEDKDDVEAALEAIVLLARDKDGELHFSKEDKPKLLRAKGQGPSIVRVSGEILNAHTVQDPLG